MPPGIMLSLYAGIRSTAEPGESPVFAFELYWLLPVPLPRGVTYLSLQRRMANRTRDVWEKVARVEGWELEGRATRMALEMRTRRTSDVAVLVVHSPVRGRPWPPSMSWEERVIPFFGRKGAVKPGVPTGIRLPYDWKAPLSRTFTLDHDSFSLMAAPHGGGEGSVRQALNRLARAGAELRYRTSSGGNGRHVAVTLPARRGLGPESLLNFRERLLDDNARTLLDRERHDQLQTSPKRGMGRGPEPAHPLRASGVLWDEVRPFDPGTLAIGPAREAGRWWAWSTRGGLKRRKG